jgi:superfamily II DNA/RNA helicase
MSIKEQNFQKELQLYLLSCYLRLSAETNILEQLDIGIVPNYGIQFSEDKKSICAKELHGDILNSLEVTLIDAEPNDQTAAGKIQHRNLVTHTRNICIALNTLFETGVKNAVEELDELMALSTHANFDFAKRANLRPENLLSEIEKVQKMVQTSAESLPELMIDTESQLISSRIVELMKALLNPDYIDWSQTHPMALVLVKERSSAKKISGILQGQREISEKCLKVTHLVGHGSGSGDGQGMAVQQQKKVLRDIKNHKYQIVIATSVAEEGIDIPECELVVTMNLPSSVTALVQMRGRARKENSKFVVLCNDKIEEEKLSELMKKEDNMIKAANFLFDSQKKQEAKENES